MPDGSRMGESVVFELERFERRDGRLEVDGRWHGVRGRRFIRPTLTVGPGHRLLAELEHKPWAADDSRPWRAAFAIDGPEELELPGAELAVAPDIAVRLPAPGGRLERELSIAADAADEPPRPARGRRGAATAPPPTAGGSRVVGNGAARAPAGQDGAGADREREGDAAAAAERRRLLAERDRAVAERDAALTERDAARTERDAAVGERDAAVSERDAAVSEREDACAERDAAVSEREDACAERDAAVTARSEALAVRSEAEAARDAAASERAASAAAARRALAERDLAIQERDRATRERDRALAARDALRDRPKVAAEPVPIEPARPPVLTAPALPAATASWTARPEPPPALRRHVGWLRRALAIIVLAAVVLAVAIIAHLL